MKFSIDRIDQEKAVLEDETGARLVVEVSVLPPGAREGSVLTKTDGVFTLVPEEEMRRRKRLFRRLRRLKGDNRQT